MKTARIEAGVSQSWVAEQMRLRGFEEFEQTKVSGIERGVRPLRMNEAVALARIISADLIGMFVASVAEDSTLAESAVIAERLAYKEVLSATERITELMDERTRVEREIVAASESLEVAEKKWERAHHVLEQEGKA